MKRLIILLAVVLASVAAVNAQSRKSDELYGRGVELYRAGKYAKAADMFLKSAEIDEATIDPMSSRYSYSRSWLAGCYYKMGYEDDAKEILPYLYSAEPVDRRLTVESDALSDEAMARFAQGDFEEAERLLLRCGQIEQSVLGEGHYYYAGTLSFLIELYMNMDKDPAQVERIVREALAIYEKSFGKDNPAFAATQAKLAQCRFAAGDSFEAIRLCKASLEVLEKLPHKEEDGNYISAMSDLALYYLQTVQYPKALDLYTRLVELTENAEGKESYDYIYALNGLSSYYYATENLPEAIRLETEAIDLAKKMEDVTEETLTDLMYVLPVYYVDYAITLSNRQNFTEAIEMNTAALQILDELGMRNSNDYVQVLLNLSQCQYRLEYYDRAIATVDRALEIIKEGDGLDEILYVAAMNYLSTYHGESGDLAKAAEIGHALIEYEENSDGVVDEEYLMTGRAAEYYNDGDIEKAIALQMQAIESHKSKYGNDPDMAFMLENLALYHASASDYMQAATTQEQALAILEELHMESSAEYARALEDLTAYNGLGGNFSGMYRDFDKYDTLLSGSEVRDSTATYANTLINVAISNCMAGEFNRAEQNIQAAAKIILNTKGSETPEYSNVLQAYSLLHRAMGDYLSARMFAERALQILAESTGRDNVEYANGLSMTGQCYGLEGNPDKAIELEEEAVKQFERMGRTDESGYLNAFRDLANNYILMGPTYFSKALEMQLKAVEVTESYYGTSHYMYLQSISELALYHLLNHNYAEAKDYAAKAMAGWNEFISSNFIDMTAGERGALWNMMNRAYTVMIPMMAYFTQDEGFCGYAYDASLMSKGFLLNSEIEISRLVLESGNDEAVSKYKELQRNRMRLNKLYEKPVAEREMDADSISRIVKAQEVELVRLSKDYGNYTKNLNVNWKEVQKKLNEDDAAVEFLLFPYFDDEMNIRSTYAALTLSKDDKAPHLISLFSPEDLADVDKEDYYTTTTLSTLVWKPLAQVLEGKKNVYFSPSGELYNIAIESIPDYGDGGLVSDRWNLYRLSSTRSIALERESIEPVRADIYGGLAYSTGTETLVNDFVKYGGKRSVNFGTVDADSLGLRGGVSDLPGTKVEADKIDRVIATTKISSTIYTDTLGTETSLKALSGKRPNILHIATHGFFWTESEASEKSNLNFLGVYNDNSSFITRVEDMALTRSGLLFAGANIALKGGKLPQGVDDGILTAKEISVLDLRGLDLVVLSACQTGLGEITGDGVFGLQRGFKKAGANSLLMSLWKVEDQATQLFMTHFYYDLLYEKMTKRASFLDAQDFLRKAENGKFDKPECWAAFILLDALD